MAEWAAEEGEIWCMALLTVHGWTVAKYALLAWPRPSSGCVVISVKSTLPGRRSDQNSLLDCQQPSRCTASNMTLAYCLGQSRRTSGMVSSYVAVKAYCSPKLLPTGNPVQVDDMAKQAEVCQYVRAPSCWVVW